MKKTLKFLSLIFAVSFIWAAYVQWNDPDAILWYAVYGVAAIASILYYLGRLNYWVVSLLCILYLVGSFYIWPEKFEGVRIGDGEIDNIERARESLGLLILTAVMLLYALEIRSSRKSKV